ncbi:fimbrillin family protein [Bacteroides sp. OttesenSCG-928-J23]|nr:fimbrillin family protein [Bacteroides sp. OttesenSCG-928-N06]MDL2247445.1 fimbrillin family protein [Bacteroides sp. OttesenSCG-928-J23]MDL2304746.1 fimbrillin family protein [Bacteroides sp. OttesenSCG-928-D19]
MKKLTMHNAQLTIIIAIILLSLAACTSEELNPSIATSTLLVAPPPAWSNGSGTLPTRATIDLTTLKTKWEDGDQLTLTATYHHKSGYKETETAVTYTRATGAWPEMKITWPIGNITHADVAATITGKDNGTGRPIFYGTATGVKPGQPITITFGPDAHRTAALQFKNLLATDVVNVPALGITNSQERIFYFAPTGSKLTGTAAGENFTIDMGTSPLGKVHYVKAGGHQAGGDNARIHHRSQTLYCMGRGIRPRRRINAQLHPTMQHRPGRHGLETHRHLHRRLHWHLQRKRLHHKRLED